MSWTIKNACIVVRRIEPICSRYGLLVGIYGSVARGENGRDLDLMLCPKCCHYNITACVNAIAKEFSGQLSECYHGFNEDRCLHLPDTGNRCSGY